MNPSLLVVALVDDDIVYRTHSRAVLEKAGLNPELITEFESAEALLAKMRGEEPEKFHLVVTDNNMPPGMSGIVLIDEIHHDDLLGSTVKCILLTSEASNEALQSLAKRRNALVLEKIGLGTGDVRNALRQLFPD